MIKNRLDLAKYFGELGLTRGAEIGVFAGRFSEVLFESIPDLHLTCVDPWVPYPGHPAWLMEEAHKKALARLKDRNCVILRKTSLEASRDIPDGSLDFVYIDGNHDYGPVKEDIEAWTPKVRSGGIVSGDDYYVTRTKNRGVITAVDEYVLKHGYELKLTPWDKITWIDHDDRQPNWYFIK